MTTPPDYESLFDAAETLSLSPRLAWMRKHNIITHYFPSEKDWLAIRPFPGDEKKTAGEIMAEHGESADMGMGDTEDDAITAMARNVGLLMWNEEVLAK